MTDRQWKTHCLFMGVVLSAEMAKAVDTRDKVKYEAIKAVLDTIMQELMPKNA